MGYDESVTADGCPVEVYRHLPANGEPELIHRAIPAGSRVLELGCGTGRLAHPLAALGHLVVRAAMLAYLRPVRSRAGRWLGDSGHWLTATM